MARGQLAEIKSLIHPNETSSKATKTILIHGYLVKETQLPFETKASLIFASHIEFSNHHAFSQISLESWQSCSSYIQAKGGILNWQNMHNIPKKFQEEKLPEHENNRRELIVKPLLTSINPFIQTSKMICWGVLIMNFRDDVLPDYDPLYAFLLSHLNFLYLSQDQTIIKPSFPLSLFFMEHATKHLISNNHVIMQIQCQTSM